MTEKMLTAFVLSCAIALHLGLHARPSLADRQGAETAGITARLFEGTADEKFRVVRSGIEFRGDQLRLGTVSIEYRAKIQAEMSTDAVLAGTKRLTVRRIDLQFQAADLKPGAGTSKQCEVVAKIFYDKNEASSRAIGKATIELDSAPGALMPAAAGSASSSSSSGAASLGQGPAELSRSPALELNWKVETGDMSVLKNPTDAVLVDNSQLALRDLGKLVLPALPAPE